ncbi:MAG: phosphate/phosphite/phosphonate ABC transporter substrate-binding protein [Caldimicrobium sp.]|nr:phosphate/phosphite/phosphonate ABC transporter substrate-binding protein [Caldimicrobium sp.]
MFKIVTLILLFLTIFNLSNARSTEIQKFTFGVVPQFPPDFIEQAWGPVLREISLRSGYLFELKIKKTIPEFEKGFLSGEFDFAFMNPYHMVVARRTQKYEPIIRDATPLTGILVVKKESSVSKVEDLNGTTIAFPAPNAFGASLYMRALLTEKFKIKFTPKYVKTHDNVYRHVVLGMAEAGGGGNQTFQRQPDEIRNQLRILYETPPSAPHPIAVHPRVPHKVREIFVKLFFEISREKQFEENFKNMQLPQPLLADYKRDYKPLEKLKLERYWVEE